MANFSAGAVLPASALNDAINGPTINAQTSNYTLVLADAGKLVTLGTAAAGTVTVPPNSSVAFTAGAAIAVAQTGAGQVTIAAGSGVTLRSAGSALKISQQYGAAQCYKIGTNEWLVVGNITT